MSWQSFDTETINDTTVYVIGYACPKVYLNLKRLFSDIMLEISECSQTEFCTSPQFRLSMPNDKGSFYEPISNIKQAQLLIDLYKYLNIQYYKRGELQMITVYKLKVLD